MLENEYVRKITVAQKYVYRRKNYSRIFEASFDISDLTFNVLEIGGWNAFKITGQHATFYNDPYIL